MRSVDPLTLKLHKKENWINLITFNNFSIDFQRISYLNKIVNFYLTKRHNILSKLKAVEFKKKICIKANVAIFSLVRKKMYKFFFKRYLFFKKKKRHFFFSTFFEKNFKLRSFDFFFPNKNFYKKILTSCFFSQTHIKNFSLFFQRKKALLVQKSLFTVLSEKAFQKYTNIFTRIQFHGKHYVYMLMIFRTFFFYKTFVENFLQNALHKRVLVQPKFFFIKYFGKRYRKFFFSFNRSNNISQVLEFSQKKKRGGRRFFSNNFSLLLSSLSNALVYNQPELFLKGILAVLDRSTNHRLFYRYLETLLLQLGRVYFRNIRMQFSGRFLINRSMRSQQKNIYAGHKISVQNFSKQIYYGTGVAKTFAGIINVRLW